jgi:hypothetical protein
MIECQSPGHARTAIVPHDRKALEAQPLHQLELVLCHRALGVCGVCLVGHRLGAVPVLAQRFTVVCPDLRG